MSNKIYLVDAGTGNLHSVYNALQSLGADVCLTGDPRDLRPGARVVLPGVGAFGKFMTGMRQRGLDAPLLEAAQRGDPVLGICVGMQAFFETGEELGRHAGLGLLPGRVARFPDLPGLKIPHTGWNQLLPRGGSSLLRGLDMGDYAYFNHSFYCAAADEQDIAAVTEYGLRFASAVERGSLFGVQFHPEKSQRVGLKILENFLNMEGRVF